MPEFIMPVGDNAEAFEGLDSFTQGFITALFFTEEERLASEGDMSLPSVMVYRDEDGAYESAYDADQPLGFSDLSPCALDRISKYCEAFYAKAKVLIDAAIEHGGNSKAFPYDEERAGNDFWFTLSGCGVSFDDRGLGDIGAKLKAIAKAFPSLEVYLGDDGMVYAS